MPLREGEYFILYGGPKAIYLLKYSKGLRFSTHLGELIFPEHIEYGDKLKSNTGHTFYLLFPSTSDLILFIKRKTTIMYPKDIGYLILETGVSYGKKVAEVGSGSGGLTVALATIVGKEGKVFSFERMEEFHRLAKANVENYGLSDRVEFIIRDVALDGFGIENMDVVFVDVPEPWNIVPKALEALKPGGFWASLSPNIEQVQKTVFKLEKNGFIRIKTVEILEREILIREGKTRPRERMISHTGYLTTAQIVRT